MSTLNGIEVYPQQLIVLGRGMEADGPSDLTLQRALAVWDYAARHELDTVVFSGGASALSKNNAESGISEAKCMADIADLGSGITVRIEDQSQTTAGNLLNSLALIDTDAPTGLFAHAAQLPRALLLGRLASETTPFVGIAAEDFGADREPLKSRMIERANYLYTLRTNRNATGPGALQAHQDRMDKLRGSTAISAAAGSTAQYR